MAKFINKRSGNVLIVTEKSVIEQMETHPEAYRRVVEDAAPMKKESGTRKSAR